MSRQIKNLCGCALAMLLLVYTPAAAPHPSTEQFIPVGYWSSVGRPDTYVGELSAVSARSRQLTIVENGRDVSLLVGPTTRIYVDRSHLGQRSRMGTLADCVAGYTIEIKLNATDRGVADWIKVKAER